MVILVWVVTDNTYNVNPTHPTMPDSQTIKLRQSYKKTMDHSMEPIDFLLLFLAD